MELDARRGVFAATALLLASALWLPLWSTRLEAPQYRGDEALMVRVHATRVSGDVKEIETLNQYIGVRLPLDAPELRAVPWVLALLCGVAVMAALASPRAQRRISAALVCLMLVTIAAAAALAQYRLYALGHHRGHTPLARVPDFTPPILGSIRVENFHVHMAVGLGGWAFLAALVLAGAMALRRPPHPSSAHRPMPGRFAPGLRVRKR